MNDALPVQRRKGGRVLFIVYYLPPMGSSGVQRPLKLIKYLPSFGWDPLVVAPEPGIYHTFDESLAEELDATGATIHRVQAKTLFHSAGGGARTASKIPESIKVLLRSVNSWFYFPDNKKGWIKPAIEKCKDLIPNNNIDVIFSTAPPYSNHIIAIRLGRLYNLPVVLDFRDDWLGSHLLTFPTRWHRRRMKLLEEDCFTGASLVTAINEPMLSSLKSRGASKAGSFMILPQGFDPADFPDSGNLTGRKPAGPVTIMYNGIFYGKQSPKIFLKAIRAAIDSGEVDIEGIRLVFQGGLDKSMIKFIQSQGLQRITENRGYLPHKESVKNLMDADLLWFTVGRQKNENQVTTGKLFEYIGTGKPILGLVPDGEAASLLNAYGAGFCADPDSVLNVQQTLVEILNKLKAGTISEPDPDVIGIFNRIVIAGSLAKRLDDLKVEINA
jgi:glycosyltransferase involved in cell wall biosynthesis